MPTNMYMFFVAAIIPLFVGFVYYSEFLFGKKWMAVNGFTKEYIEEGNMAVILGLAYLFSVMLSFGMGNIVVHQPSVYQMMMSGPNDLEGQALETFNQLMATYGDNHRSWKHGAVHGTLFAVFSALPIVSINALFERRGAKYILIHFGYWLITLVAVGALLSATLQFKGF